MRKIDRIGCIALSMILVLFVSCDKEETPLTPEIEEPAATIVAGNVSASAFTATINGSFDGLSKVDLALAKKGVLYCAKSDNAETIFKSWKDGNDNPDCIVFQGGDVEGVTYKGTIVNLSPDTEYSFCLFSKKKDDTREISAVSSFRTTELKPDIKSARVDSVRYFYAVLKGSVVIDSRDAGYCNAGLLLSTKADGNLGDSACFFHEIGSYPQSLRFTVSRNLYPERPYYLRAYVSYKTSDGKEQVIYGPETSFTTGSLDDWGVDLGLPSHIKWSKCELGRQEFESGFDYICLSAFACAWGAVERSYGKDYVYWDASSESYIDIGDSISGTQYDVAHVILGGNWRLPTKADVEELIRNCTIGTPRPVSYTYRYDYGSATYTTRMAIITGPNGKQIKSRMSSCWTGTMSEDGEHPYVAAYSYDQEKDSATIVLTNNTARQVELMIRPVWDPNM